MSDEQQRQNQQPERGDHSIRRRTTHGFLAGLAIGGLAGALLAGGAMATVAAAPFMAARGFHGHHRGVTDPESAREHLDFAAGFVLSKVDATEEQEVAVKQVVARTVTELWPLRDEHRANREAIHDELSRVEIDPAALERIRQQELALAEEASRTLTDAFVQIAETLSPEQRIELLEMGARFHR